jgi:hypothetical protein
MQRHFTENWKQLFSERKLRGLSSNYYIHLSVIYICPIGIMPILLPGKIGGAIVGIYKTLTNL